jgi:hypothetical protein
MRGRWPARGSDESEERSRSIHIANERNPLIRQQRSDALHLAGQILRPHGDLVKLAEWRRSAAGDDLGQSAISTRN